MPPPQRVRTLFDAPLLAWAAALLVAATGCTSNVKKPPPVPPPPTYTGPAFLHGTIGSLATVRGVEPQLVSGFGLVVGLRGTGSTSVPAFLRQWLIQEMRRRGVGTVEMRKIFNASPEQVLTSGNAAVVAVEGFLPPGAVKGTRFDALVSALPQTETTSLEGGRLWWAVDLSAGGTDPELHFSRRLALAEGSMYLNPYDPASTSGEMHPERDRQAVLLSGGVVSADRPIEIFLNQPSWTRSRMIADRINERFRHEKATQSFDTAVPADDKLIRINVPARFARRPEVLLNLISHLYLQRGADFESSRARELAALLAEQPRYAADVTLCWQSLGKMALPVLRQHYSDEKRPVMLAALEAGASLGDEAAVPALERMAADPDPAMRGRAAEMFVYLPQSLRAAAAMKALLDDAEQAVRLAAYRTVVRTGDPTLVQQSILGGVEFKFILDLIPSQKPLIYISQADVPRIALFDPDLGFKTPAIAKLWDNHLMLRSAEAKKPVSVYYQPPGEIEGKTFDIAPTVANLLFLLAHKPVKENPSDGLDLNYSQVVNALYTLQKNGKIEAPLEIQINPLAQLIARARLTPANGPRPETGGAPGTGGTAGTPGTPGTVPAPATRPAAR